MANLILALTAFVLAAILAAIGALIVAIPVYFLWNWLIPTLFFGTAVTYFQAWGLVLLSWLLIKGGGSTTTSK